MMKISVHPNTLKFNPLFWIGIFILLITNAYADVYRCRDSAGHLITSDREVPECADKSTKVYTNNGILKDQLTGKLTPEQRRTAEFQEQQRANELRQLEKRQKEQRYLLAHYPAEQDIEVARKKEIDAIDAKMATEKQLIDVTKDELSKNRRAQTRIPKNQNQLLIETQMKEDGLKQTLQQSNRLIQRYNTEKTNINRRFDETHTRYLEVVVSNKK